MQQDKLPAVVKKNQLLKISDLWRWDGEMERSSYLIWGSSLCTVKFFFDTYISNTFFHHSWSIFNYIAPGQALDVLALSTADKIFYGTMLGLSLPFIWTGVSMTMRRLRAAGLPIWLVKLFFIPVVNLIMFTALCILPSQKEKESIDLLDKRPENDPATQGASGQTLPAGQAQSNAFGHRELASFLQANGLSEALYALVMTVPPAAILSYFGVAVLQSYGWGLFIGIPFAVGMASTYLFGRHQARNFGASMAIATLALTLLGASIFFFAWEGMVCLIMAAPLAYALAYMGAFFGYSMQKKKHLLAQTRMVIASLLLIVPVSMGAEYKEHLTPPLCAVHSSIDIAADPQTVWKYVIAFPPLPPPQEPIFKIGIAYPQDAIINGHGQGAVRHCRFSTGEFVEPIYIWKEPQLLQFGVSAQPEPMKELSFIHNIQPAHLNGYLNVRKGEFRLAPRRCEDGSVKTRIIGTTWYENRMWPASYWSAWTDYIVHNIHNRVLVHIKNLSEKAQP